MALYLGSQKITTATLGLPNNFCYTQINQEVLIPSDGIVSWNITHNLETKNIICSLYINSLEIVKNIDVISNNQITVTFNSTNSLEIGTCKVVILSQGGNAFISDSALSSTSENPVQNKVLYPSLSGFIPTGTVIKVKTDDSGDFTTLEDALSHLAGKWSNGSVIVELSAGTFTTPDSITINSKSIPNLTIKGQGKTSTILQTARNTSNTDWIFIDNSKVFFQGLKFKSSTGTKATSCRGINVSTGSLITLRNCAFDVLNPGVWVNGGGTCVIQGAVDFTNSSTALYCSCGVIRCTYGPSITLNNITTCFNVEAGGQIHFYNPSVTKTNITNIANQTVGTPTANGWITGIS